MNIIILNGSPKGDLSVTMQYVAYLAKIHPEHQFNILNIAQRIKLLEHNPEEFNQVIEQVNQADALIWGFPLYVLMVHAHYKRFIELIWERNAQASFAGKYTASLSTSIHFFDHTAHNYIHAICDDLQMNYVDYFSADMNDLRTDSGRQELTSFFDLFMHSITHHTPTQPFYQPLPASNFIYSPAPSMAPLPDTHKKIVILHDEDDPASNLGKMIARCADRFGGKATVVNINKLNIKASCIGCLKCGGNNQCSYIGKDDYIEFYKNTVMTADILIYAGRVVDRFLSSRWKMFFDRIFFNTHTPVLIGKQISFLISGPFSQVPNIMEILHGFFEFQGANMVGVVSDEMDNSPALDKAIDDLPLRLAASAKAGYVRPHTFLGVGGMNIFRDDIYGRLRTVFAADHRAYKKMGIYRSFPQNSLSITLLNTFIAPIVNIPSIRRKFDQVIKEEMVNGFKSVIQKASG
jgi:multimeric flavodoxin WrbA